ncbi:hypothetical protein IQ24_02705 [Paracoccus sulfuroxidans]|uniref:Uncharacterized protein n=1 Tax=Paracoccus sulfuroxidans TaxID=384678 RepID=A0A562NKZ5_9RHOB|nr:hypothetical protein IQ24_02705 [Paracoccus sulfuroxidans]
MYRIFETQYIGVLRFYGNACTPKAVLNNRAVYQHPFIWPKFQNESTHGDTSPRKPFIIRWLISISGCKESLFCMLF